MTTTPTTEAEPIQHGNFRRPSTAGIGRLGVGPSLAGLVLFLITYIIHSRYGTGPGLTALGLTLAYVGGLLIRDKHGISPVQKLAERWHYSSIRRAGLTTLSQGPLGRSGQERTPPPGILASTDLIAHTDPTGATLAMLYYPHTHVYATPLVCEPNAGELHDQAELNDMVRNFGHFSKTMAYTPGVRAYTITVATTPDHGSAAASAVEASVDPRAPQLGQDLLRDAGAAATAQGPVTTTWVTPLFEAGTGPRPWRRRDDFAAGAEAARAIPGIIARLGAAGAGVVRAASTQEVVEATKTAYDPGLGARIEAEAAAGRCLVDQWADAGPSYHVADERSYTHDSGHSVTWVMTRPQEGPFPSDALAGLLAPHPLLPTKRVTFFRRVIPAGLAAEMVEMDYKNARARASTFRVSAAAAHDLELADATRAERVKGAALEDFTILITVTVTDPADLPRAVAVIEGTLAPEAGLLFRPVYGAQDTAFAAGLGWLGLDLNAHNRLAGVADRMR